jgi:hypothetical protein
MALGGTFSRPGPLRTAAIGTLHNSVRAHQRYWSVNNSGRVSAPQETPPDAIHLAGPLRCVWSLRWGAQVMALPSYCVAISRRWTVCLTFWHRFNNAKEPRASSMFHKKGKPLNREQVVTLLRKHAQELRPGHSK